LRCKGISFSTKSINNNFCSRHPIRENNGLRKTY
jgi:hypothetical protein